MKYWTKRNKEYLFLNLFLYLMWLKSISILFIKYATWQDLILSCIRFLLIYIYIYIYIYIDWFEFNGKVIDKRNMSCLFDGKTMSWEREKRWLIIENVWCGNPNIYIYIYMYVCMYVWLFLRKFYWTFIKVLVNQLTKH